MTEHTEAKKSLGELSPPMARRRTALQPYIRSSMLFWPPYGHTVLSLHPFSQVCHHVWPYPSSSTEIHGSAPFPWVFDPTYHWHEWLDTVTCFSREENWVLPEQKPWDGCLSFVSVMVTNIMTKSNFVEGRFYFTLPVIVHCWGKLGQELKHEPGELFLLAVLQSIILSQGLPEKKESRNHREMLLAGSHRLIFT